jgi:hypothetical protein
MAYHIQITRSISCDDCLEHYELLSPTDKMAAEEAREIGWQHTRKGWICPQCNPHNASELPTTDKEATK